MVAVAEKAALLMMQFLTNADEICTNVTREFRVNKPSGPRRISKSLSR